MFARYAIRIEKKFGSKIHTVRSWLRTLKMCRILLFSLRGRGIWKQHYVMKYLVIMLWKHVYEC